MKQPHLRNARAGRFYGALARIYGPLVEMPLTIRSLNLQKLTIVFHSSTFARNNKVGRFADQLRDWVHRLTRRRGAKHRVYPNELSRLALGTCDVFQLFRVATWYVRCVRARISRGLRCNVATRHKEESMIRIAQLVNSLRRREEGQDLLEYALLVALIALVAVGGVMAAGVRVNAIFNAIVAAIPV